MIDYMDLWTVLSKWYRLLFVFGDKMFSSVEVMVYCESTKIKQKINSLKPADKWKPFQLVVTHTHLLFLFFMLVLLQV